MNVRILVGDALSKLAELPDESVHCVVTSPPYWGLRAYKGDPGMIGLEPTFDEHLDNLVAVFREVRRVLREDGTLWLNYGDAYAGGGTTGRNDNGESTWSGGPVNSGPKEPRPRQFLKAKDLMMMPARVAMALQADGWWLRSEIIWHKPNPMPESCTDRPTSAHEKVYLFAKGEWKSRVVKFANLDRQSFHFSEDFWTEGPALRGSARLPVDLAAAIFDGAQRQYDLCLPALHSEVWDESPGGGDRPEIGGLPIEHRPAVLAARFLRSHLTAEVFLRELQRFRVTHADGHDLLVRWASRPARADAPSIAGNGEGSVAVHYPGEICKIDFPSHAVSISRPRRCDYYYDAEAVRVPCGDYSRPGVDSFTPLKGADPAGVRRMKRTRSREEQAAIGANLRNVWKIATHSFKEAHFATFPPKLVEPCIKAGTSAKGCCGDCGAPWGRLSSRPKPPDGVFGVAKDAEGNVRQNQSGGVKRSSGSRLQKWYDENPPETTGWRPTCQCDATTVPATVLDPFAGSGTVGLVADRLQRDSILIEISADYAAMARKRIDGDAGLLAVAGP